VEKQFDDDTVSVDEHRALKVERERERSYVRRRTKR